jgi:PAS domain S-box-containing protein
VVPSQNQPQILTASNGPINISNNWGFVDAQNGAVVPIHGPPPGGDRELVGISTPAGSQRGDLQDFKVKDVVDINFNTFSHFPLPYLTASDLDYVMKGLLQLQHTVEQFVRFYKAKNFSQASFPMCVLDDQYYRLNSFVDAVLRDAALMKELPPFTAAADLDSAKTSAATPPRGGSGVSSGGSAANSAQAMFAINYESRQYHDQPLQQLVTQFIAEWERCVQEWYSENPTVADRKEYKPERLLMISRHISGRVRQLVLEAQDHCVPESFPLKNQAVRHMTSSTSLVVTVVVFCVLLLAGVLVIDNLMCVGTKISEEPSRPTICLAAKTTMVGLVSLLVVYLSICVVITQSLLRRTVEQVKELTNRHLPDADEMSIAKLKEGLMADDWSGYQTATIIPTSSTGLGGWPGGSAGGPTAIIASRPATSASTTPSVATTVNRERDPTSGRLELTFSNGEGTLRAGVRAIARSVAIIITDTNGTIVHFTEAALELLSCTLEEVQGKLISHIIDVDDHKLVEEMINAVVTRRQLKLQVVRFILKRMTLQVRVAQAEVSRRDSRVKGLMFICTPPSFTAPQASDEVAPIFRFQHSLLMRGLTEVRACIHLLPSPQNLTLSDRAASASHTASSMDWSRLQLVSNGISHWETTTGLALLTQLSRISNRLNVNDCGCKEQSFLCDVKTIRETLRKVGQSSKNCKVSVDLALETSTDRELSTLIITIKFDGKMWFETLREIDIAPIEDYAAQGGGVHVRSGELQGFRFPCYLSFGNFGDMEVGEEPKKEKAGVIYLLEENKVHRTLLESLLKKEGYAVILASGAKMNEISLASSASVAIISSSSSCEYFLEGLLSQRGLLTVVVRFKEPQPQGAMFNNIGSGSRGAIIELPYDSPLPTILTTVKNAVDLHNKKKEQQSLLTHSSSYQGLIQSRRKLGSGSFGTVYEVKLANSGKLAMKEIASRDPTQTAKIAEEVKTMKNYAHRNIVAIEKVEIKEDKSSTLIFMEYCDKGNLTSYISNRSSIDLYEVSDIMRQLMTALEFLHSHQVMHRDVKLDNILIKTPFDVKLADFGQATRVDANAQGIAGTGYYMAPEATRGSFSSKCDIWSAGIVCLELLGLKPSFITNLSLLPLLNYYDCIQLTEVPTNRSKGASPNEDAQMFYKAKCGKDFTNLLSLAELERSLRETYDNEKDTLRTQLEILEMAREFCIMCLCVDAECRPEAKVMLTQGFVCIRRPSSRNYDTDSALTRSISGRSLASSIVGYSDSGRFPVTAGPVSSGAGKEEDELLDDFLAFGEQNE